MNNVVNNRKPRECPVCGMRFVPQYDWQKYDKLSCGDIFRHRKRYAKIREAVKLLDKFKARRP